MFRPLLAGTWIKEPLVAPMGNAKVSSAPKVDIAQRTLWNIAVRFRPDWWAATTIRHDDGSRPTDTSLGRRAIIQEVELASNDNSFAIGDMQASLMAQVSASKSAPAEGVPSLATPARRSMPTD
jgi:hypothetical protein